MSITEDAAIRIDYTLIRGVQLDPHEMNKDQSYTPCRVRYASDTSSLHAFPNPTPTTYTTPGFPTTQSRYCSSQSGTSESIEKQYANKNQINMCMQHDQQLKAKIQRVGGVLKLILVKELSRFQPWFRSYKNDKLYKLKNGSSENNSDLP
ncbi:hypothetical protein [Oryza sativa Japonica Group]|uniref:Uncharacterized protein n=1 Tax=Oryza sativa subsp. japonica TaxID=39947 RepID=Q84SB9_ORYSJ|nr:hypothetical protein [Oryza sativa Japonica Group]